MEGISGRRLVRSCRRVEGSKGTKDARALYAPGTWAMAATGRLSRGGVTEAAYFRDFRGARGGEERIDGGGPASWLAVNTLRRRL